MGNKVFHSQDVLTYCSDRVWNEPLVFIVNDEGIAYRVNDIQNDSLFHSKYTEIGNELNAFIRYDYHEILIFRYSNQVGEWFVDFLFKLWEVLKRDRLPYSGVYHILEHSWYNVLSEDNTDGEINEIVDVDVEINNFIVAFVIIGLSHVYSVKSGDKLTNMKVYFGKGLKSVEFRTTLKTDDEVGFYSTNRYILSYDAGSESYYLKE